MTAVAYVLLVGFIVVVAMLYRALHQLERSRCAVYERDWEVGRLEAALEVERDRADRNEVLRDFYRKFTVAAMEAKRDAEQERDNAFLSLELVLLEAAS